MVLVDAGPLVALVNRNDSHHEECRSALLRIRQPLATAWPPFTEAMYLVRDSLRAQNSLWEMVSTEAVNMLQLASSDCSRMRELMVRYSDLPMDLADAALVRLAERERIRRIFTIDRRDFQVYRPKGVGRFEILP